MSMADDRRQARLDRRRLRRLASGDIDALGGIYDDHCERLFRLAWWITGSRDDAEEVVQAVMVKLAGMGEALLGIRRPGSYLARMTRHEALDRAARATRAGEAGPASERIVPEPAAGPEAERIALAAQVREHLAALRPEQREAVYLHLFEAMTFREIGGRTGVSTFTAASRYRLALERLRERLKS